MFMNSFPPLANLKKIDMRVVIVTQEDPFYMPIFLGKALAEFKEVVAIVILPRKAKRFGLLLSAKELYSAFGLRDFLAYGTLFVWYKLLDLLTRWRQPKRFYSVQSVARRNSISVHKLKNINHPESLNLLKALDPEVIVSVASPQIFKKEVIGLPKYAINTHGALLPKYRGKMPSFWVLAKGEEKTGVTVHYIDENIDAGDIILQRAIDISPQETLHSLQNKIAKVGAVTLLEALEKIEKGDTAGIPPIGESSYYSFPTKEAAREFRSRGRGFI